MADTSSSSSFSSSQPFAPDYITQAGQTAQQLKDSAQTSAAAQLQRLNDYLGHLNQMKNLARASAASLAKKSGGAVNPAAQFRAMTEMANQAGIPIDTEIAKQVQGSNNIENTMNQLIQQAGGLQAQLGSIMKSQGGSSSSSSSGGSQRSMPQSPSGAPANQRRDLSGNLVQQGQTGDPSPFGNPTGPGSSASGPQGFETLNWMAQNNMPLTQDQRMLLAQGATGAQESNQRIADAYASQPGTQQPNAAPIESSPESTVSSSGSPGAYNPYQDFHLAANSLPGMGPDGLFGHDNYDYNQSMNPSMPNAGPSFQSAPQMASNQESAGTGQFPSSWTDYFSPTLPGAAGTFAGNALPETFDTGYDFNQ